MKQLFVISILLLPLFASAQYNYISTSGDMVFESGATVKYTSPDLIVDAQYNQIRQVWTATVQIFAVSTTTNQKGTFQFEYDNSVIDGFTASGSTNSQKIKSCILQAVTATLTGINGAIFTIH